MTIFTSLRVQKTNYTSKLRNRNQADKKMLSMWQRSTNYFCMNCIVIWLHIHNGHGSLLSQFFGDKGRSLLLWFRGILNPIIVLVTLEKSSYIVDEVAKILDEDFLDKDDGGMCTSILLLIFRGRTGWCADGLCTVRVEGVVIDVADDSGVNFIFEFVDAFLGGMTVSAVPCDSLVAVFECFPPSDLIFLVLDDKSLKRSCCCLRPSLLAVSALAFHRGFTTICSALLPAPLHFGGGSRKWCEIVWTLSCIKFRQRWFPGLKCDTWMGAFRFPYSSILLGVSSLSSEYEDKIDECSLCKGGGLRARVPVSGEELLHSSSSQTVSDVVTEPVEDDISISPTPTALWIILNSQS